MKLCDFLKVFENDDKLQINVYKKNSVLWFLNPSAILNRNSNDVKEIEVVSASFDVIPTDNEYVRLLEINCEGDKVMLYEN